jgi:hypothetical protein
MPQRKRTKTEANIASPVKRITLPITLERYRKIVEDCRAYRAWVDEIVVKYPESFPKSIGAGYSFHDERTSGKLNDVRLRQICLKTRALEGKKRVFTLAPSGVLPYFVGCTDDVEKALFLRRFDVPYWGLECLPSCRC